jgi:hypothetical protein
LTVIFSSKDFSSIPHALDLVNSLNGTSSTLPSDDVAAFLERIESADPDSPDFSEDDQNQSWGHWQFTSGNMTCSTVLTSWDHIGITTARRLIAAAVKTCKVARHICFERGINSSSYLSDAYLENVVELLWKLKQADSQVSHRYCSKKSNLLSYQTKSIPSTSTSSPTPTATLTIPVIKITRPKPSAVQTPSTAQTPPTAQAPPTVQNPPAMQNLPTVQTPSTMQAPSAVQTLSAASTASTMQTVPIAQTPSVAQMPSVEMPSTGDSSSSGERSKEMSETPAGPMGADSQGSTPVSYFAFTSVRACSGPSHKAFKVLRKEELKDWLLCRGITTKVRTKDGMFFCCCSNMKLIPLDLK